jgi:hypothetical protein
MDNLEKVTVLLNDILSSISRNDNVPVDYEKLCERNVLKKDPGDGSYPDLLTHVIEGCQSTFNNFTALKKDSFFHVRDRSFLDTATRSFLDNYLKYDYEPFLFMQDYGVYKIIVVVKPVLRDDNVNYRQDQYYIASKLLLDEHNHLVKHADVKPAIVLFEETGDVFKFFSFHENYYTQVALDSFDQLSNYSVVCKKYDNSIICKSYYMHYLLDIIPFKRLKFIVNNKDYSADLLLNYDEILSNYTQTELVKHMVAMDQEHFDLLAMYLI